MPESGTENYPHVKIHLCQSCSKSLEVGDEVVSVSDGYVDENGAYDVRNMRFWHRDCFPAPVGETSDMTSTDIEHSEGQR